jgi:putative membrane protein
MKVTARYLVIGAAVLALACDRAERNETHDDGSLVGTAGENSGNVDFVETSMTSGMIEVELGKMAQQKASDADVKRFAEMMVRDHSKAGDELKQVAQRHQINAQAELMQRLSGLSGAEFDREYMKAMVDSHQSVVDHLESRADVDQFGDNRGSVKPEPSSNEVEEGLNQWAAKTLPTARHHLEEAQRIEDRVANRFTPGQNRTAEQNRRQSTAGY